MKKLLLFLLSLPAFAATPTLTNFNAEDFTVDILAAPTNVIMLNLNTNQFSRTTNGITITNVSGVEGATNTFSTIITTNIYSTNITANFITVTTNITVGGTNIASVNPTDGRIPVRASASSFQDSPISILSPSQSDIVLDGGIYFGPGASNKLSRGPSDEFLFESSAGTVATISANSGYDGTGDLFLSSDGTYKSACIPINPTDTYLPYRISDNTFGDSPWYVSGTNAAIDSAVLVNGFVSDTNYSRLAISHTGTNGYATFDSQSAGTAGAPKPIHFNFGGTNLVEVIPTNSWSGLNIIPQLRVVRDDGIVGGLTFDNAGNLSTFGDTGALYVDQNVLWAGKILPKYNDGFSLGDLHSSNGIWKYSNVRTNIITGYDESATGTNYSLLSIYHTGTNGAVVLDSQSSGTAGDARPFNFASNSVPFLEVSRLTQIAKIASMVNHSLYFEAPTSYDIRFMTGGAERWEVDPDGHLIAAAANSVNIGIDANGITANSPKNIAARDYLVMSQPHTPGSSSETNYQGAITWDANYIYVWTATNVNKRAALTAW